MKVQGFWQEFLNLFFAQPCALCQRSAPQGLCARCEGQVRQCGLPLQQCHEEWRGSLPLFAWGRYEDALKRSIAALKYDKRRAIGLTLGQWMGEAWQKTRQDRSPLPQCLTVVPIPLHPRKLQQRGFNQAEVLAEGFCRRTGLPLMPQGLLRVKETEAQFSLSAQARLKNIEAAFQVSDRLRQRMRNINVLLLDDIFTTGATAQTAQATLRRADVQVYGMVTLARAGKRSS